MAKRANETKNYKKGYYLVKVLDATNKNSYGVPKLIGEYDIHLEKNHSHDDVVRKVAYSLKVKRSSILVNVIEPNKRVIKEIKDMFKYDIKTSNTPEEYDLIAHADGAFLQRLMIIYNAIIAKMKLVPDGSVRISIIAKAIEFYNKSDEEQKSIHKQYLEETKKQKNTYLLILTSTFELLIEYRGKLIGEQNEQG